MVKEIDHTPTPSPISYPLGSYPLGLPSKGAGNSVQEVALTVLSDPSLLAPRSPQPLFLGPTESLREKWGKYLSTGFHFNLTALIQKKRSFQELTNEITILWPLCNFKEKFNLLSDAFLKLFSINSIAIQGSSSICGLLSYTALALPAIFFMAIGSLIFSIQSLLKLIASEKIRYAFLDALSQENLPKNRLTRALDFFNSREKTINDDLQAERAFFCGQGVQEDLLDKIFSLKKTWALTAIYGEDLTKTSYTQISRIRAALEAPCSEERSSAIIREGNEIIDDFLATLKTNSIETGILFSNELLTAGCAIIASLSLIYFFPYATVLYWTLSSVVIAISLSISAYKIWRNRQISPQEKETTTAFVLLFFNEHASMAQDFIKAVIKETHAEKSLTTFLHQKKTIKKITRAFIKKLEKARSPLAISAKSRNSLCQLTEAFFKSLICPQESTLNDPTVSLEKLSKKIAEAFVSFSCDSFKK